MTGGLDIAAPEPRLIELPSHRPLLLDDPSKVWIVRSGSVSVFGSRTEKSLPVGNRRFLFSAAVGDALFSALSPDPSNSHRLFLLSTSTVTLLEIPLERLESIPDVEDVEMRSSTDAWVDKLGSFVAHGKTPVDAEVVEIGMERSLAASQTMRSPRQQVAWIGITEGRATLMGQEAFQIGTESDPVPLSAEMWIDATENIRLSAVAVHDLPSMAHTIRGLAAVHALVLRHLSLLDDEDRKTQLERLARREENQRRVMNDALGSMSSILGGDAIPSESGGDLMTQMRAIGGALGVSIRAPLGPIQNAGEMTDQVGAIAKASRVRIRRVLLDGEWWKRDCGPLMGFLEDGKRPIALLRDDRSHYFMIDSRTNQRMLIDVESNALLGPEAVMFYRPLSDDVTRPWKLIGYSLRVRSGDALLILALATVVTLMGMLVPQATGIIVDSAIPDANGGLIFELGLALVALAFGAGLFSFAQGIVSIRFAIASDVEIQSAVWDRLLNLHTSFFRRYSTGDLHDRVTAVGAITHEMNGATLRSMLAGVTATLNLGLLFYYSPPLATIALLLGVAVAVVTIATGHVVRRYTRELMELRGRFFGLVVQLVGAVGKIRVAGAQRHAFALWARDYSRQLHLVQATERAQDHLQIFNQAVPTMSTILLFWFAVEKIIRADGDAMSVGTFLAFNVALGMFIRGTTSLSDLVVGMLDILTEGERVEPILAAEMERDDSKVDPGPLKGAVTLSNVAFAYSEDSPRVLDDLSLHVNPGELVALVGPSGCGKSTVLRLLLGFEKPLEGTVSFDGQDAAGLDVAAVRRQIGVVLQSGRIDAGSILEVISSGVSISLSDAWEALEDAGLADEVREMSMGLHTIVSEGGGNFSGGQVQRLLISRALVANPRILLMDEATSALDNRTQAIVMRSLDRRNVTRLVVAHRLSTIQSANRIYVMDGGRVVEHGGFDELMEAQGLFRSMMERQQA